MNDRNSERRTIGLTVEQQPSDTIEHQQSNPSEHYQVLLDHALTQWQFGDWSRLSNISRNTLRGHPERAKLAALMAAANLQNNNQKLARQLIDLAIDWGVSKRFLIEILVSGVHNSLGRATALNDWFERAQKHFELAISVGMPNCDSKLLAKARLIEQFRQLGKRLPFDAEIFISTPLAPTSADYSASADWEFSSEKYWEDRYKNGGTSGHGSYNRLAEFKANVINCFIADNKVKNVIEFGCGDGNQLAMLQVGKYIGVDVSPTAIKLCRRKFENDATKTFYVNGEFNSLALTAELTLSLDVIFHLVEDDVFSTYMNMLFRAAERYCIIYACDEELNETDAIHVRRRKFTKWIAENLKNWRLAQVIYNKYPHDGSPNPKNSSFSNFYFYERV